MHRFVQMTTYSNLSSLFFFFFFSFFLFLFSSSSQKCISPAVNGYHTQGGWKSWNKTRKSLGYYRLFVLGSLLQGSLWVTAGMAMILLALITVWLMYVTWRHYSKSYHAASQSRVFSSWNTEIMCCVMVPATHCQQTESAQKCRGNRNLGMWSVQDQTVRWMILCYTLLSHRMFRDLDPNP